MIYQVFQVDGREFPTVARDLMCFHIFPDGMQKVTEAWESGLYAKVADVDAENLDHVYELTNLWYKPEAVRRVRPMHSTSIGDIIKDPTGTFHVVAQFGFDKFLDGNND